MAGTWSMSLGEKRPCANQHTRSHTKQISKAVGPDCGSADSDRIFWAGANLFSIHLTIHTRHPCSRGRSTVLSNDPIFTDLVFSRKPQQVDSVLLFLVFTIETCHTPCITMLTPFTPSSPLIQFITESRDIMESVAPKWS